MQTSSFRPVLMALLCAAVVSAAACQRGAPQSQNAQNAPAGQGGQTAPAGQSGQTATAAQAGQSAPAGAASEQPSPQPRDATPPRDATQPQNAMVPPDATPAQQDAAAAATAGQGLPTAAGRQGDLGDGRRRLAGDRYRDAGAADSVLVPSGTHLTVELETTVSSSGSREGESVRARVVAPVTERGLVVIPSGSEVIGVVTRATGAGRIGGRARLGVRFTELLLPSGASVPIRASWAAAGRSKTGRDAAIIGGSAAGGGIIGHNVSRGNRDKGTVIGALVGAAVGTAVAANAPGRPVVLPSGATLRLRLRGAIEVPVPR